MSAAAHANIDIWSEIKRLRLENKRLLAALRQLGFRVGAGQEGTLEDSNIGFVVAEPGAILHLHRCRVERVVREE